MAQILNCRLCGSSDLQIVWNLQESPYGDLFQQSKSLALQIPFQSLTLALCANCSLLQITEITDLEQQYNQYLYNSTTTHGLGKFYSHTVDRLISDFSLITDDLILDIGSNDGSFLIKFKEKGFEILGVEPAEMSSKAARDRGVNTLQSYFDSNVVTKILEKHKYPKLISINYTLANVPNVHLFLNLISELMDENSILSIITGYHPDQFVVNMFYYVGHDHLSYFTIESIDFICKLLDLKILDVSRVEHKGGSVQILIVRTKYKQDPQPSVTQMIQREKWLGTRFSSFYQGLKVRIEESVTLVKQILESQDFEYLNGVGASISTTYFSNQFSISQKLFALFDDDVNKIGRFSPGAGLEVFPLSALPSGGKYLTIVLAWQHTDKLLSRLKENNFTGRVLVPLPTPRLIVI